MIRVRKSERAAALAILLVLAAGCGGDDPIDPVPSTTTTDTSSIPGADTTDPTPTTAKSSDRGLDTSALPADFSYRVGGWTFDVSIDSLPRLQAEKTVDPSQPPGTFALTMRARGELSGAITSTDTGRDAPVQQIIPFLEYKGYAGPPLAAYTSTRTAGCDSDFDINSRGMGGSVTLGSESVERSDVLYCGGLGSFSSDGSLDPNVEESGATEPNSGDPLLKEPEVDAVATFLNDSAPAVYVDVVAADRNPCRLRLAEGRVLPVGGPCELLGGDGSPVEPRGAELTVGQVWGGRYLCGGEYVDTTITIDGVTGAQEGALVAGATFEATVKFRYSPYGRDVQSGSYGVHGVATDPYTITMSPGDWIDKANVTTYMMDTFNATVSRQVMDGTVVGCGTVGFGPDGPFTLSGTA